MARKHITSKHALIDLRCPTCRSVVGNVDDRSVIEGFVGVFIYETTKMEHDGKSLTLGHGSLVAVSDLDNDVVLNATVTVGCPWCSEPRRLPRIGREVAAARRAGKTRTVELLR